MKEGRLKRRRIMVGGRRREGESVKESRRRGRKGEGRGGGGGLTSRSAVSRRYRLFYVNLLAYRDKYELSLKDVAQMFCLLEYLNIAVRLIRKLKANETD